MKPTQIVEAILFASDAPLSAADIVRADATLDEDAVERALQELRADYDDSERAFEIVEIAEGYQILTRAEYAPYIERFDTVPKPNRLSGPSLETLSIIAYRQPIGRIEIEYIRGVSSAGVIRTLQDRGLVDVVGRDEGLGRPLLYGTTSRFLEHFGFRTIEELPRPEELPVVLRDRVPLGPASDDDEGDGDADGGDRDHAGALTERPAEQLEASIVLAPPTNGEPHLNEPSSAESDPPVEDQAQSPPEVSPPAGA